MRWAILPSFIAIAALAAMPARAGQDDPRLPQLFVALKATQSPAWAQVLEDQITQIWGQSRDAETQQLMEKGLTAMAEDEEQAALKAFDALVAHAPGFAEGWNKRATVEFLLSDYQASMTDIARTLQLEPGILVPSPGSGRWSWLLAIKRPRSKPSRRRSPSIRISAMSPTRLRG